MNRRSWIALAALLLPLVGCEKHMQDMYDQPRYKPLAASPLFPDGGASRPPVPGTELHARGDFSATSSGRVGTSAAERWSRDESATNNPYPVTLDLLKRGAARFTVYCTPCHSPLGDGDGFVVRRGCREPPTLKKER